MLSIGLAVVPPWINPDATNVQLGLVVGLLGLCVTFLVEQHIRGDELTVRLHESAEQGALNGARETAATLTELTPVVRAPTACRVLVERVANDWQRIDQHGKVPFFGEIRASLAGEFSARLAELANGAITVAVDSPYTFRDTSLRGVRVHRLISVGSLAFWSEEFGRHYLAEQRRAIKERGVRIERTMVIAEAELPMAGDVAQAQVEAGVDLQLVVRERVKQEHTIYMLDRGIVYYDNGVRMVVELSSTSGGRVDRERLSTIPAELEVAETGLLVMRRYSHRPADLLGRKGGQSDAG